MQHYIYKNIVLFIFLLISLNVSSQPLSPQGSPQNANWVFPEKAGLDFNTIPPNVTTSPITIPALPVAWSLLADRFYYGPAAISNDQGQLQFYSYSDTIFYPNGTVMQNGAGLMPASVPAPTRALYSESGMLTVPFLGKGNTNKYYVFSLKPTNISVGDNLKARLYYSVVDMSLNGGQGAVVSDQKGILLDSLVGTRLIAATGSRCNIWILTIREDGSAIHAFEITEDGIASTPVISPCNVNFYPPGVTVSAVPYAMGLVVEGAMRVSPDNKKIAVLLNGTAQKLDEQPYVLSRDGFVLFDFDNANGIASNQMNFALPRIYNTQGDVLGQLLDLLTMLVDVLNLLTAPPNSGHLEFSPDNSKLYYTRNKFLSDTSTNSQGLLQYNLNLTTQPDILASQLSIDTNITSLSGLRLGADDKLYLTAPIVSPLGLGFQPGNTLHRLENPNLSGTAAGLTLNAITLPSGSLCGYGFGPPNCLKPRVDPIHTTHNIVNCAPDDTALLAVPYVDGYTYLWDNGETVSNRIVTEPGVYWVVYGTCPLDVDTFIVRDVDIRFSLGNDTLLCDTTLKLSIDVPNANYLWKDSSTLQSYLVTESGEYYATVDKEGCSYSDTINVNIINLEQELGDDTIFKCTRMPISVDLKASVPDGAIAQWNTGSGASSITVSEYGEYYVTVRQEKCKGSDTVVVAPEMCDCITMMPTAFSPNGDGRNDIFQPVFEEGCPINNYELSIFDRFGTRVFVSFSSKVGWNGTYGNKPADIGTYYYSIEYFKGTHQVRYSLTGDVTLVR